MSLPLNFLRPLLSGSLRHKPHQGFSPFIKGCQRIPVLYDLLRRNLCCLSPLSSAPKQAGNTLEFCPASISILLGCNLPYLPFHLLLIKLGKCSHSSLCFNYSYNTFEFPNGCALLNLFIMAALCSKCYYLRFADNTKIQRNQMTWFRSAK